MKPSREAKEMIPKLNFDELEVLATENNNLDVYRELVYKPSFERVSEKLGLTKEFRKYKKLCSEIDLKNDPKSFFGLKGDFELFLFEKICFPQK